MIILIIILFCILLVFGIVLFFRQSILKNRFDIYENLYKNIIYCQTIDKETGVAQKLYINDFVNIIESILEEDKQLPPNQRRFFK
ncbi:MAG: hypothetical protein E7183_07760 [Erysipelotrichaceae bacterium]|nr:hypothetical protein [Erysipelotrichaceae bacterium]